MEQIKAIIIDDEAPSRLMIRQLVYTFSDTISIIGEAANGREAIGMINALQPNLIFLDIEMPDKNGFEVLAGLSVQPMVVFITAYDQFAIHAFKENTIDYLIKPVDPERFRLTLDKIKRFAPLLSAAEVSRLKTLFENSRPLRQATAIPVHIGNTIKLIPFTDLCYAKADNGYVDLVTISNETFLSDRTLGDLEQFLPADFIRVQKSYIINRNAIKEISRHFNNRFIFTMNDRLKTRIVSGKSYAAMIRGKLSF